MATRPATPETVDWMIERLEGMRLAREIAKAGGALTNPFHVGTGQHIGFQNVANLHHFSRMAGMGGLHQHPTFSVPQGL